MTCPPHHWLLDTPSPGITRVAARCKRCGIMTDLGGRELDEALARAMGWTLVPGQWRQPLWNRADETVTALPEWHASLDALLRDIEPVCRERGMKGYSFESLSWMPAERRCRAYTEPWDGVDFEGPTAATALARAFLAVMERDR